MRPNCAVPIDDPGREFRVIEEVEELSAELQPTLFASNRKFLKSEKSQLLIPGPMTVFRPAVPQRNGAARANAAVLKKRSMLRSARVRVANLIGPGRAVAHVRRVAGLSQ